MTKAEEYQNNHKQLYEVDSYPIEVVKELERNAYIAGEKDTIERAVEWLRENWRNYVWTTDNGIPHFGHWENDFRQAMEEEQ